MNPQPYTKNYRQLRNTESGRNSLPQGKAHQLVMYYQMSALKTYIQVRHIEFMYLGVCIYVATTNGKRDHEFEKRAKSIWEGFEGGKGRTKLCHYINPQKNSFQN